MSSPGVPLVLVFGSASCSSCAELFPHLARWQTSLALRLRIVLVVGGDRETARSISEQHGIAEVLADPDGEVSRSYGMVWSPSALTLNSDGSVINGPATGPDAIEELLRLTLRRAEPIPIPWKQTTSVA
jgi:hypothetical protein